MIKHAKFDSVSPLLIKKKKKKLGGIWVFDRLKNYTESLTRLIWLVSVDRITKLTKRESLKGCERNEIYSK